MRSFDRKTNSVKIKNRKRNQNSFALFLFLSTVENIHFFKVICTATAFNMNPIRSIKEKVGSAVEDIAVTAPQFVKDTVVSVGDKVKHVNEEFLEPAEQKLADEHGYTHGGKREKLVKHFIGVGKYESGAHFLGEHVVDPMRKDHDKRDSSAKT